MKMQGEEYSPAGARSLMYPATETLYAAYIRKAPGGQIDLLSVAVPLDRVLDRTPTLGHQRDGAVLGTT
jgi:hypothetical protein